MLDLKFIQFFISVKYGKSIEEYYSVQSSTVSNWRKRGIPNKQERFDEYMFWNNHGTYWHLDHIIPISWAKSEEEVYKLNHYTNYQPLSAFENLAKNNRFAG